MIDLTDNNIESLDTCLLYLTNGKVQVVLNWHRVRYNVSKAVNLPDYHIIAEDVHHLQVSILMPSAPMVLLRGKFSKNFLER